MSGRRTAAEIEYLKAESMRRILAGEARVDIARDLGVPPSTIGTWASEGQWRRKDLPFDINVERGRAQLALIAEAAAAKVQAATERETRAKELGEAAMAAMRAADPNGDGKPPGMAPAPTHQISMQLAHDLVLQGRLEEADRAARFALRFAKAQQVTRDKEADRWREDRRQIMAWWENHRETFIAFKKYAEECIAETEAERRSYEEWLEYECCPGCCRPMEFWPAQMDEKMEQLREDRELNDPV